MGQATTLTDQDMQTEGEPPTEAEDHDGPDEAAMETKPAAQLAENGDEESWWELLILKLRLTNLIELTGWTRMLALLLEQHYAQVGEARHELREVRAARQGIDREAFTRIVFDMQDRTRPLYGQIFTRSMIEENCKKWLVGQTPHIQLTSDI